jgi:hypothetical protein
MRFDVLLIVIGLILIAAMTLTLIFGREYSRHGYGGVILPPTGSHLIIA